MLNIVRSEDKSIRGGIAGLEHRFTQFENNVLSILRDQRGLPVSNLLQQPSPSNSGPQRSVSSPSEQDRESDLGVVATCPTCHHTSSTSRIDIAFPLTNIEDKSSRPTLLSFTCPPFLKFQSWDHTESFYDDEIRL